MACNRCNIIFVTERGLADAWGRRPYQAGRFVSGHGERPREPCYEKRMCLRLMNRV